ncbi:MAG: DUF1819 family protein [Elusimicrobia bacterium]|nr:DUF1819 family protein [Candidatus Omnitrophota bacterium]MCG2725204.1 DUF1819 family protein [Elusimicrobiota bacterium]
MKELHYKANITAGALLIPESRKIADLMLRQVSVEEWKKAIEEENILQKLSVSSSRRVASFIRARLGMMDSDLWKMVRDGDGILTTQALFSSAIKHCRILGDYLDIVVREQFRKLEDKLTPALWDEFIISCKQRDPSMEDFPPSTAKKMRSVVHKILVEVGYLQRAHNWTLKRIEIVPEIMDYLKKNNEFYILKCIQVSK